MCKRSREDIYEQMVQLNDTSCRIAAASERIAVALERIAQSDMTLIDFDDLDFEETDKDSLADDGD